MRKESKLLRNIPLALKHTGVVFNDFTEGLLTGAGMGCARLALVKMPRKTAEK